VEAAVQVWTVLLQLVLKGKRWVLPQNDKQIIKTGLKNIFLQWFKGI